MVEFALVLPLLALLLLLALDFGRVFFGWVGLQNAARIGASYAAMYPEAWGAPGDATKKAQYAANIQADAAAINCRLQNPLPAPTYPNGTAIGEDAVVAFKCNFDLITPFLAQIMGSPIELNGRAVFSIRSGEFAGPAGGNPPPPPPPPCHTVPNMVNRTVAQARNDWFVVGGFTGAFTPPNGQDTEIVSAQATSPASIPGACIDAGSSVTVVSAPPGTCPAGQAKVPSLVGMLVSAARTKWSADGFTGSFSPNGQNSDTVLGQTTTPLSSPNDCRPLTTTVTVTHGPPPTPPPPPPCTVPNFISSDSGGAQALWTTAGFKTTVSFKQANKLPYKIGFQSLVSNSKVVCIGTSIQVGP
jgi:hypothetical protein